MTWQFPYTYFDKVKCASLPSSIWHSSHARRHHKPLTLTLTKISHPINYSRKCHGCDSDISVFGDAYICSGDDGCDFALDLRCVLLPSSVTNREWDKHPLKLTFDASRDHPSDFFCEFCEREMHPKNWMYHCRECDASFHLNCLKSGSGDYRNMKFGGRYEFEDSHPNHPLSFTCVTLKKHCDLCSKRDFVYTRLGFECASCYYVVCYKCGVKKLEEKRLSLC